MATKSYKPLATNSRYLKRLGIDSKDSSVSEDDRKEAENLAAVEIDAQLSKTFSTTSTPPLIALLADVLGSATILEWAGPDSAYEGGKPPPRPEYLRARAKSIFDDLRAHKIGIQNQDGTWDADYPKPSTTPRVSVGEARNIAIDPGLTWGEMAPAHMTDDEKRRLDEDRSRRSTVELGAAAIAGRYGL